jgi:NAD(P)H-dependent flavin oxidoreductase YrpB (nitropropane dioxygenase family)
MNYRDFFGCNYPIVAAPMNRVSDAKLAIACHNAGIFPSLSLYAWQNRHDAGINEHIVEREIKTFQDATGSSKILISLASVDLFKDSVIKLLLDNNIKFLEFIASDLPPKFFIDKTKTVKQQMKERHGVDFKIITKRLDSQNINPDAVDAIMYKTAEGAGRGEPSANILDELEKFKNIYPTLPIIMSGGIGCADDVKKYMSLGCMAICIGTLLAASEESSVSRETKLKMIEATVADISRTAVSNQSALVFSKLPDDDMNNTHSLIKGLASPDQGLVFAGKGIDYIKKIKPVKDIIQELVS